MRVPAIAWNMLKRVKVQNYAGSYKHILMDEMTDGEGLRYNRRKLLHNRRLLSHCRTNARAWKRSVTICFSRYSHLTVLSTCSISTFDVE